MSVNLEEILIRNKEVKFARAVWTRGISERGARMEFSAQKRDWQMSNGLIAFQRFHVLENLEWLNDNTFCNKDFISVGEWLEWNDGFWCKRGSMVRCWMCRRFKGLVVGSEPMSALAVNGGQLYSSRCAGTKKLWVGFLKGRYINIRNEWMNEWNSKGVDNTTVILYSKNMSAARVYEELTESFKCTVNPRQLLSAHKNHIRKTSLFTSAIPNQVRNSQTSRFVSFPVKIREVRGEETAYSRLW